MANQVSQAYADDSARHEGKQPLNSGTYHTTITGHSDTNLPFSDSTKSWDKPGAWGSICRGCRNVQRYIWDDPDKPAEEKKFLLKLDLFLLTYACLGYFCKGLDQQNINNAYVSGMKEALSMDGSELTYMTNVFAAGYVVGQLPAVILARKIRPSVLVSTLEILWAVLTFCCAAVNNVSQLYALRFLVGLCEGAFFPSIIYVIGSWCTIPLLSLLEAYDLILQQTQKLSVGSALPSSTRLVLWHQCSPDTCKQVLTAASMGCSAIPAGNGCI